MTMTPETRRNCLCYQQGRSPLDRATCAEQGHPALPGVAAAAAVGTERHVSHADGSVSADVDGVPVERTHPGDDGRKRIADVADGKDATGATPPHASTPRGRK